MNSKPSKSSTPNRKQQNKNNNKKTNSKQHKKSLQTTTKRNIAHTAPQSTGRNVLNLFAAAGGGGKKQQNVEAIHSPLEFAMYAPTVGAQVGGFEGEYASRYRSATDHLSHTSYAMRDGMANNTNNFVQAMGSWMSHMDWKFNNANKHLLQLRGEYLPAVHFEGLARSQEKEERDEEQYRQRKQERRFQKMLQQTQNHQRSQHNARHMQQTQQQSLIQKSHKAQGISQLAQKSPVKVMEQQLSQQQPKRVQDAQQQQQQQPQERQQQQQQHKQKQTTEGAGDELMKAQTSKTTTPPQQTTPPEARAPLDAKKPFVSPQIQQFINQAQQPQQKKQPHNAEQLKPMPTPEFLDEKKNVDIETTKMYLAMPLDDQTVAQNKKNEKTRNKAKTTAKTTANKQSKMTVDAAGVVVDGADGKLNELDVIDPSHHLVAANGADEEQKEELNTIIRGVDAKNHTTSQSK